MLYKSMQYTAMCALIAFVFCETLLIPAFAKPLLPHSNKQWVVVIDAGHGGKDPGCHGNTFKEKDVALAVSLKLGHFIEENDKNVKVIYTRSTDVFIPLNERADIANRNHADFFICVHCNASPDKTAFGSATYVMGLYKSQGNLEVSKRENSSVLYEKDYKKTYNGFDPNSAEGNILFSMYQNMYLEQSLDLSTKIQKEYVSKAARTDNGVKQAGFLVLWKTTMPSLLTEIGFLTNPAEETYLGSSKGQNKIAQCIFFALQQYIDEKEGLTFNADDYKNSSTPSDSVTVADTTAKLPDTPVVAKAIVPEKKVKTQELVTNPVTVPAKGTLAGTSNIKESVKTLHTDSVPITVPKLSADSAQLIYKVQIVVSTKALPVNAPRFKNVRDVEMYMDKTTYKYTTGHFSSRNDAVQLQSKLRNGEFKDAFVVAFKGKNRVQMPVHK